MASYKQQKKAAFAHLRVSIEDAVRFEKSQFTLFDFVEHVFSFSPKRRQLAAQVISLIKERSLRFKDLLEQTRAPKSGLHLVTSSLENSGLVKKDAAGIYALSVEFCFVVEGYSAFWRAWVDDSG